MVHQRYSTNTAELASRSRSASPCAQRRNQYLRGSRNWMKARRRTSRPAFGDKAHFLGPILPKTLLQAIPRIWITPSK